MSGFVGLRATRPGEKEKSSFGFVQQCWERRVIFQSTEDRITFDSFRGTPLHVLGFSWHGSISSHLLVLSSSCWMEYNAHLAELRFKYCFSFIPLSAFSKITLLLIFKGPFYFIFMVFHSPNALLPNPKNDIKPRFPMTAGLKFVRVRLNWHNFIAARRSDFGGDFRDVICRLPHRRSIHISP